VDIQGLLTNSFLYSGKLVAGKKVAKVDKTSSYGKQSVPKGPYREVNGFLQKLNQEPKKNIFQEHQTTNKKLQMAEPRVSSMGIIKKLKSCLINMLARENSQGREVVDFGQKIGKAYDMKTGKYIETTRGTIHYSKDGAHIVPAKPLEP